MAIRNVLVHAPPGAVWSVLADGHAYDQWVVGTRRVRSVEPGWPAPGTSIHFTAGVGPVRIEDRTTSRICEEGRHLELEAHGAAFGSARVAIHILPWGDDSVVVLDEHPLRGSRILYENPLVELALTLRSRRMLGQLAAVVERRATRSGAEQGGREGRAAPPAGGAAAAARDGPSWSRRPRRSAGQ
ncbi:MAG: SRPBCC family protein [Acidimicrobiales bacterium]